MEQIGTAPRTPPLKRLVESIRVEVSRSRPTSETARAVADHLERMLDEPDLLTPAHREPDEDSYRQHVLHVEPDGSFSVVCLVWLPGQETPIHDHVAWCVPGVYRGREEETRYRLVGATRERGGSRTDDDGALLMESGTTVNEPGTVAALTPPGDIHRVRNPGPGKAISLHVYGADIGRLGSSIRRTYDLPVHRG